MDQAFELAREFVEEKKKVSIYGPIEKPPSLLLKML